MFTEKDMQLVNALLNCRSIKDASTRKLIVQNLPGRIPHAIDLSGPPIADVQRIISTCRDYSGGLEAFFQILRFLESNSIPMSQVDELLNQPSTSPSIQPDIMSSEAEDMYDRESSIRVLHLSDLHFSADITDIFPLLQPLLADIQDQEEELGFDELDYLVISGDMSDRANVDGFQIACEFTQELRQRLNVPQNNCICVPGNHDLSWDTTNEKTPQNFSDLFFAPLTGNEYPLNPTQQGLSYLFPQSGLQFITLNSGWEIDKDHKSRTSINRSALARCLLDVESQKKDAIKDGYLSSDSSLLRIAVWHHPVGGVETIHDTGFLEQLRRQDVKLGLHGHIHENTAEQISYQHPRQMYIVGAGSFGAVASHRPESTPRLYNLLEIDRNHRWVRVHTRRLMKESSAWSGWHVWPKSGIMSDERLSYYTINF